MSVSSRENSVPSNILPVENLPLPTDIDTTRLPSGLICNSTSVSSKFLKDSITIVNDFRNLRDIKAEIDFTSIKYIAEGDFGKVSSARLNNGSEVAIKKFKEEGYKEYYTDDIMLAKIWNEAANFIKLKGNPKFVELFGIYTS
jgi:hypothetical protein